MRINVKKILLLVVALCLIIGLAVFFLNKNGKQDVSENEYYRNSVLTSTTVSDMIYDSSKEVNKGPTKTYGKVAYITIDDGPSVYTGQMLDILKENNVKATFFMVNGNMNTYPDAVKRLTKEGHTPGFHSVTHDVKQLYKTSTAAREEFDVCANTFKQITGETSKVIRLPFGSKPYTPQASFDNIINSGYKLWDWTLDTEDWKSNSQQIMDTIKKYAYGDEIVLLIHERTQTVAVLDQIIKYLKSQGYEILPISQTQPDQNYWNGRLGSQN